RLTWDPSFALPQAEWADLAGRIGEVLQGQTALPVVNPAVEAQAQRYAAQLIARQGLEAGSGDGAAVSATELFQEVDLSTLALPRQRRVAVERAALSALRQPRFEDKLAELGFKQTQI